MSKPDLKDLIEKEREFFEPIINCSEVVTADQLEEYRQETVSERRKRISREILRKYGGVVQFGPFSGMRLDSTPSWGRADQASMILGVYEAEVLNAICSSEHQTKRHFVDLGAADGFYAVGGLLSKRFDHAYCFEMTTSGQDAIRRNAKINNVEGQLTIFGKAGPTFYEEQKISEWTNVFMLCDVEGAEFDIFSADTLRAIRGSTVVIEIHNWVEDFWEKYEALLFRAAQFFTLETLSSVTVNLPQLPYLRSMHDDNRALIRSEGRPNVMRYLKLSSVF